MKTGLTIEELATEIMRQRDVKTDYIVDTTKPVSYTHLRLLR